jgi:hypothetical protein
MFRIEAFCEDKNLPRILHQLKGLVLGQPGIQPVSNAKAGKNGVKAKTSGDLMEMFEAHAKKHGLKEVAPKQLKTFAVEHGYAEGSYSAILSKMLAAKHLRKKPGKAALYLVTIPKAGA